jgi:hypothetical protein
MKTNDEMIERIRGPFQISDTSWYYVYPHHVEIVVQLRDSSGVYIGGDVVKIPKWKLRAAITKAGKS